MTRMEVSWLIVGIIMGWMTCMGATKEMRNLGRLTTRIIKDFKTYPRYTFETLRKVTFYCDWPSCNYTLLKMTVRQMFAQGDYPIKLYLGLWDIVSTTDTEVLKIVLANWKRALESELANLPTASSDSARDMLRLYREFPVQDGEIAAGTQQILLRLIELDDTVDGLTCLMVEAGVNSVAWLAVIEKLSRTIEGQRLSSQVSMSQ